MSHTHFPARPNLFVVGSMKAGTTSLARHLGAHPQVFMTSDPKEPTYFLDREQLLDVLPGVERRGFWRGEEFYLQLFAGAGDRPVIGEASANYARLGRIKGVAEKVAQFNPRARIMFIMRDPVERTISHYWYMVRFFGERRDMLSAIQAEPDYIETSYYAMQLEPWLRLFGREQVMTLTTESLRDEPENTMAGVFDWLGVDATQLPGNLCERANEAPPVILQVQGSGLLHRFRHSRIWTAVGPWIPKGIRSLGRQMSEKPVERKVVDLAPIKQYLRPIQRKQTAELEILLGRSFPEWTTLAEDT